MNISKVTSELKAHFLRLYQIALSDDEFDPLEWKMLYHFAEERNIPKAELDKLLLSPTEKITIPDTLEKRIEYLYDFAQMIWADGKITEDERNMLIKYCKKFEFEEENLQELADYLLDNVRQNRSKGDILNELK